MSDIEMVTFETDTEVSKSKQRNNYEPSIYRIMVESFLLFHTPKLPSLLSESAYTAALEALRENRGEEVFRCCHTREVEAWRLIRLLELKKVDIRENRGFTAKNKKAQAAEFESLIRRLKEWLRQDPVVEVFSQHRHRTTT